MENQLEKVAGTEVSFQIPNTEALGMLSDMSPAFSLTLSYRKAEDWAVLKDKEVRAFFMGLREIPNDKGEVVKCGTFVTENECFLSAQTTLIEAVRNLDPGTAVAITYRGRKTNKVDSSRSTCVFDVSILRG